MYGIEVVIYFLMGIFVVGNTILLLGLIMKLDEEKEKMAEAEISYFYPQPVKKKSSKVHRTEKDGVSTYQVEEEDIVIEEI